MATGRERTAAGTDSEAAAAKLTQQQRARLANILARLSSPFEAERAAAGLLATAFIDRNGLEWPDLVAMLKPAQRKAPEQRAAPEPRRAAEQAPMAERTAPPRDRRRAPPRPWQGYNRRRSTVAGQSINCLG